MWPLLLKIKSVMMTIIVICKAGREALSYQLLLLIIIMWSWKRGTQPAVTLRTVCTILRDTFHPSRSSWSSTRLAQDPPALDRAGSRIPVGSWS